MALRYLLLLFPALSLARIDIDITGEFDCIEKTVRVDYEGSDTSFISDMERNTFMLNDETLKDGAKKYFGILPDNTYVRSPTPWGDLYTTYNWPQVTRTLTPKTARVLNIHTEPQIIMKQNFRNGNTEPATVNVGLSKSVENTVSSTWSKDGELTVTKGINYDINLGNTTILYTSLWNTNAEKSTSMTLGSDSIEILLEPGQSVESELHVTKGMITVEIEYEATVSGNVAVNYEESLKGHHFWALDVADLASVSELTNKSMSKETIDISFHSKPKIVVFDMDTGKKLIDMEL